MIIGFLDEFSPQSTGYLTKYLNLFTKAMGINGINIMIKIWHL